MIRIDSRWRTVVGALFTVGASWALAAAAFHPGTVPGYFATLDRTLPARIYAETMNQSLLGTALRVGGITSWSGSP